MSKRLLTVYYKHKQGGFCKRLYMMLQAFLDQGWNVHYVAVAPYAFHHPRLHAHIIRLPAFVARSWLIWPILSLFAPFYIHSVAKREGIELILVFHAAYGRLCALAKRLLRIPLVVFIRGDALRVHAINQRSPLVMRAERWAERRGVIVADLVITVNQRLKESLADRYALPESRLAVLPNHIDVVEKDQRVYRARLRRNWGLFDEFVIVTSGLLQRSKRLDFLIRAFAKADLEGARLLLIGDGECADSLRKLAEELQCAHRVLFTGWRDDAVDLVRGADLFVFTSVVEGCPNSLLEALGCGLPCLASNVTELREILPYRELVFAPDDEYELALKLKAASSDPRYLAYLTALSREAAGKYRFAWNEELLKLIQMFV